jgi:syntaxin 8
LDFQVLLYTMATTNPSQLFLLADHIKLSLLERQRAKNLKLPPQPGQDNQISRSLDTLLSGIETLERQFDNDGESEPLRPTPERDQLDQLREQYAKLESQFRGLTTVTPSQPNDPTLKSDFAAATSSDSNRRNLFPTTYRDEPEEDDFVSQAEDMSNTQVHEFHQNVMARQDEQLDVLGASIGRQRELTIAIGDELDEHADLLEEVDEHMDRHQTQLDGAMKRLNKFADRAKKNWGITTIFVLVVILILLIAITK